MEGNTLNGLKVAILVTNYFEQVELTEPKKALEQAGAKATIIAPKPGEVQGFKHDTKGDKFKVDMTLEEARPEDFGAVLLPGGALNADNLRVDKNAQNFVRQIEAANKPIAVICHGPWLLVSAGLVKNHTLTSYHTIQDDIRNAGGNWQDQEVLVDRNWVSSRKPADLPAFNREMVKLFSQSQRGGSAQAQPMGAAQPQAVSTAAESGAYTSESMVAAHSPGTADSVHTPPRNEDLKGEDSRIINPDRA